MKNRVVVLVILNMICGILQIVVAFIVQPLLYLLFPVLVVAGIAIGYRNKNTYPIGQYHTMILGTLLAMNLSFFIFSEIVHLYDPSDTDTIRFMLTALFPFIFWTFFEAGRIVKVKH